MARADAEHGIRSFARRAEGAAKVLSNADKGSRHALDAGQASRDVRGAVVRTDKDSTRHIAAAGGPGGPGGPNLPGSGFADEPEDLGVQEMIARRSAMLGIRTSAERAQEASLLIEDNFLHVALVARQPRPELLFGEREWASYLNARVAARRHGDQELTVPFIVDLHRRLSQFTMPEAGGVFTRPEGKRWGVMEYPLSDREIAVVEANPRLTWLPPPTGPLDYGIIKYQSFPTREAVGDELQSLCDWYNTARRQPGHDPYQLAAELQREFVAIHPWDQGYNGRTSRLLMNWSLERDGMPPSAVADFDRDLTMPLAEWADNVRAGSDAYSERADRIERLGNSADPVEVFGLEQERERYLELGGEPAPFTPGDQHDSAAYKTMLARLRGNGA
ncbi:Fic family protein [Nocardia sp. NPDC049190]|uniref:Fic family protein n=1 Tax=Nocardia sp. NPDC049190 TaxID=3155650 RepID=UPI0033D4A993